MNLLGVDVGFALTTLTTGIAWRVTDSNGVAKVCVAKAGTKWDDRRRCLPFGVRFAIAALDAPILPEHTGDPRRGCEAAFYRGAFWNRYRPGLSHYGRSLPLRSAGKEACVQFAQVLDESRLPPELTVCPRIPIIEAFPNTFLGVLLDENVYVNAGPKCKREKRSDLLYKLAVDAGVIKHMLKALEWNEPDTIAKFQGEQEHDRRAALVCLLTAGFASSGTATIVGDASRGWFWLPPCGMWSLGRRVRLS